MTTDQLPSQKNHLWHQPCHELSFLFKKPKQNYHSFRVKIIYVWYVHDNNLEYHIKILVYHYNNPACKFNTFLSPNSNIPDLVVSSTCGFIANNKLSSRNVTSPQTYIDCSTELTSKSPTSTYQILRKSCSQVFNRLGALTKSATQATQAPPQIQYKLSTPRSIDHRKLRTAGTFETGSIKRNLPMIKMGKGRGVGLVGLLVQKVS